MKTPNEIAWNLLDEEFEGTTFQPLSLIARQRFSNLTGVNDSTLSLFWKKLCMDYFVDSMPEGIEIAKQVIDSLENGKPHYEIDSEGI